MLFKSGRWGLRETSNSNLLHNYVLSIADGSFFAFAMGMVPLNTVLTYFISDFVSQNWLIGMLTFLNFILMFCPQILVSQKLERLKRFKPFLVFCAIFQRVLWLLLGVDVLLFADSNPVLFVVLFYLFFSLIGFISAFTNITWLNLIVKIIPVNYRGRFFGIRSTIAGLFEAAGSLAMGIIIKNLPYPLNYAALFGIVFIITMISLGFLAATREEEAEIKEASKDQTSYSTKITRVLKEDRNFMAYLLTVGFIAGFGKMVFTFHVLYAKEKLGISGLEVSYATFVLLLCQTAGYMAWGVIGDKYGFKATLELSAVLFIPTILLTWLMTSKAVFYISIGLFGVAQSARNVNENNLALNLCRQDGQQPLYIGVRNLLVGPVFAFSPVIAGVIQDFLGFGILSSVSAVFIILGGLLMRFKVREYR